MRAIRYLEIWLKHLRQELKAQKITPPDKFYDDSEDPVILKRGDVERFIGEMHSHINEIMRYSNWK